MTDSSDLSTAAPRRVRLLMTANPDRAQTWARALDAAGIDVLVEIQDAQLAQPGGSPLVGILGARPLEFINVLTVEAADRERALAVLVDTGWDGREGLTYRPKTSSRGLITATAATLGGIALFIALRAVLG
jgi:hypothetical protein